MSQSAAASGLVPPERQRRYLERGLRRVDGWLDPFSAVVIADLPAHQAAIGARGGIAEIGVHHGKLFLLAYLALRTDELGVAVDVFERQELNVDRSGAGNRECFVANVRRHAGDDRNLRIIARSSLDVRPADIREAIGACRFFSVDGGHTEECTLNDIRLADASLSEAGIVVVDDYFNARWPEVSVGIARYMVTPDRALAPFLITPNKIFFCRAGLSASYRDAIHGRHRLLFDKTVSFFGHRTELYGVGLAHRWLYPVRRLKRRLQGRPLDNPRDAG